MKGKLRANAMKRVAAGAHLPTPWLFEPVKRPDDRVDYCLDIRRWSRLLPGHQTVESTTAWTSGDRVDYCLGTKR